MNLKKLFAAMSACAVAAVSTAAMSVSVNAVGFPSTAYLCGDLGTTEVRELSDIPSGSTTASISGDAQYEVEWKVAAGTVNNIECLFVNIPEVSTSQYSGMKINVDAVYIDGRQISYISSPNAVNMAYTAIGQEPGTRIYLYDGWDNTGIADVALNTSVTDSVKVQFTVSGTGMVGTSNVTNTNPTDATQETTQTSETQSNGMVTQAPQNGFFNNTTTVEAAVTGDGGIAAIAVAGLAVTACAAVLSKVKFGGKKKK